jgi:hypothetical protein
MTLYRCNHCMKVMHRECRKRWMKSFCETTGATVRLWRVNWKKSKRSKGGKSCD